MTYNDVVLVAKEYEKIDGRIACQSQAKLLSLALDQENHQHSGIKANIWNKDNAESLSASTELPLHQVLDLAILTCQTLLYFQEAYRFPKLYDPENPCVHRIGLQGGVMPVSVCIDNPKIDEDIQKFSQVISNDGEIIGERLRVLSRLLKEMGFCK